MNYQLNKAKMFADITGGTAIVINPLTGIYYGMNAFGTCVFDNLLKGSTPEEIISAVEGLENAPQTVGELIRDFIDVLAGFEIVVPAAEESSRPAVIDPDVAVTDSFIPECKEYEDAQELLFADPIHEVDSEEGWKPE